MKSVIGIFPSEGQAEDMISELEQIGYNASDISLVMRNDDSFVQRGSKGGSAAKGLFAGATSGGIIGGIAGLIVGLGLFTIPGLGAFLIGGPIAAALGLTGAAATTATGITTGVLAGGLVGVLAGFGLSEDSAREYEDRLKLGGVLLSVPADNRADASTLENLFRTYNAESVRIVESR